MLGMSRRLRQYAVVAATQNLVISAVLWSSHNAMAASKPWHPILQFPWPLWCGIFFTIALGMLGSLALNDDTSFRPLAVVSSAVMLSWAAGFALVIPRAFSVRDVSWMGVVFTVSLAVKDLIILGQPMSPSMDDFTDRKT